MARRSRPRLSRAHGPLAVPKAVYAGETTPSSTATPSSHASEEEEEAHFDVDTVPIHQLTLQDTALEPAEPHLETVAETEAPTTVATAVKAFPFLELPSELRMRVYAYHFSGYDNVVDLSPENHKTIHRRLALLRTCRRLYAEASHYFYNRHVFRVFPTHPGRFFKTRRPLLARLAARQRAQLGALELRLGPGFSKPPKCWAVTPALGLRDCISVHRLHVFVQLDPSLSFLDGFRMPGFYEAFSRDLLDAILAAAPSIAVVEFDAYESVRKTCPIMEGLLQVTRDHGRRITWGGKWKNDGPDDHAAAQQSQHQHQQHQHQQHQHQQHQHQQHQHQQHQQYQHQQQRHR